MRIKRYIKNHSQKLNAAIISFALLGSSKTFSADPFQKIETALENTQRGANTIAYIILGLCFLYAAIAGIWMQKWKHALGVMVAGGLIALWPTILAWLKNLGGVAT